MSVTFSRRPSLSYYQSTAVAIGNFDGVHLGHQQLLEKADTLLTFDPYPQAFFHPERLIPTLTTLREKIKIANTLNLKHLYALPFNAEIAALSPEKFIEEFLLKKLKAQKIIIGEDFRFGHERKGDVNLLKNYCETEIVPVVLYDNKRISSSWVREALSTGNLYEVKHLLGRYYSMIGRVVKGDGKGKKLGFPTANISLTKRIPPLWGVYAIRANHYLRGVANIGKRPTVDGTRMFLEVHLFDFDKDIYNEYLEVEFVAKIRDEKKFSSINELREWISHDVVIAKSLLQSSI